MAGTGQGGATPRAGTEPAGAQPAVRAAPAARGRAAPPKDRVSQAARDRPRTQGRDQAAPRKAAPRKAAPRKAPPRKAPPRKTPPRKTPLRKTRTGDPDGRARQPEAGRRYRNRRHVGEALD